MRDHTQIQQELGLDADGHAQLRWLAESAYLTLLRGDYAQARTIFGGLQALAPDEPVGFIGMAEAQLAAGDARAALAEIESALLAAHCDVEKMAHAYQVRAEVCERIGDQEGTQAAEDTVLGLSPSGAAAEAVAHSRAFRVLLAEAATQPQDEAR